MTLDRNECEWLAEVLQEALKRQPPPDKARRYQRLLDKLQSGKQTASPSFADGFRYDYDDSSSL